ncbi:MAG: bifunctional DNA-formamidopyrimidine glycosylase/DNA-(apurinic or apyrimidinic site) lyase [Candidatus Bipolaricaulota bacterium]
MPELPEVETMVWLLRPRVEGALLEMAGTTDPALSEAVQQVRTPATVELLSRRGKYVLMRTDAAQWTVIHPRMSGRLVWGQAGRGERVRSLWRFSTGEMRLVDQRRLATVEVADGTEPELSLGPEPLEGLDWLPNALARSRMPVKVWLMDQHKIAGIGNIYASEICFRARVDPRRPACKLEGDEVVRIVEEIPAVLEKAIGGQGTTLSDGGYRGPRGELGRFALQLAVYGREGAPCAACGMAVRRLVQSGRSTFYCPNCQH